MASALQRLCDSLLTAVGPVERSAADLVERAARLRAGGNRIGALGRSAQDLDLRSAGAQLLATAVALERSAAIARETTRQAQAYVGAMLASGQVQASAPAAVEVTSVGKVSPAYSKRLQRETWMALGLEIGRELAWEAGPRILGSVTNTELPDGAAIRQVATDLPVAVAQIADYLNRIGKQK